MKQNKAVYITTLILSLIFTAPAYAYIGPGLGVAIIGYTLGPIFAVIAIIALVAFFPLRYLYKKRKRLKKEQAESEATQNENDN